MSTCRSRRLFDVTFPLILFLLFATGATAQERSTVGVSRLDGRGSNSIQVVVQTVTDTLETVLSMTGRFNSVAIEEIVPAEPDDLRAISDRNSLDNVITGEVIADNDGRIRISLQAYNRAEEAITVRIREEADTLFSVFDAVDRAVIDLIEGLTGRPVEFGSITIGGDWYDDRDEIFLDGAPYEVRGNRITRVIARDYDLVIRRAGVGEIVSRLVSVTPGETVTIAVPLLEVRTGTIETRRVALPQDQFVFISSDQRSASVTAHPSTTRPDNDADFSGDSITLGHDLRGESLYVYGFSEPFLRVAEAFSRDTGIEVIAIPPEEHEWRVDITMTRDDPPEVIRLSQPGPIFDLIELELVEDTFRGIDQDLLYQRVPSRIVSLAERDGRSAGIPIMMSLKSLYWYSRDLFERLGLSPPATSDDFDLLIADLVDQGITPYGFSIESGEAATGWRFTDWIEDRVLQKYPPEQYDEWIRGDLAFRGTIIEEEITELTYLLRDEEVTHGGDQWILETPFWQSVDLLLRQPSLVGVAFGPSFFASWYEDELDRLDVFPSPPEESGDRRVLVGGDMIAIATATPEARAFLRYVTRSDTAEILVAEVGRGNVVTHTDFAIDSYAPFEQRIAEIIGTAAIVRYDGSDSMTRAVGMDRFLTAGRSLMKGSAIRGTVGGIEEARRAGR